MLRLEGVSKVFAGRGSSVVALQPTDLEIAAGEYVAVLGPSGSGKTTLLSVLGGMLAPTSGKVILGGRSLYDVAPRERAGIRGRKIGFVFQSFNLVPYLNALENVELPLYLAGISSTRQRARALAVLKRVKLGDRIYHKPSELSVGQQQRVALARTLANNPAIILADEATGSLDPAMRDEVLSMFNEFNQDGCTLVMVTHDPLAAAQAKRVLHLTDGMVTPGSPSEVQLRIA